jgi:outer membrane immunogenic protein
MKKALLMAAMLAGVSTTAMAADVVMQEPVAPEVVEETTTYGWDGIYAGVFGGAQWLRSEFDFGVTGDARRTANGGLLGGFVGINKQLDNNIVLGVEGDFSYNWNDKKVRGYEFGTDWAGTVRARVGYAFDDALIYGAAGWTVTRGYLDPPTGGERKKNLNGYTLAAGVDYKFTDNMFARGEYRFTDFSSKEFRNVDVNPNQHAVILGVGFKF